MKKLLFFFSLSLTVFVISCNNDDTEPEPGVFVGFEYNDQTYATPNLEFVYTGEVGQVGGGSTGIHEFDLLFLSEDLSSAQSPEGTKGFFLQAKIFSSSPDEIVFDEYNFSTANESGSLGEGLAVLDFETPATFGQVVPLVGGQISIQKEFDKIQATYSFTTFDGGKIEGFFIDFAENWNITQLD